MSEAQPPHDSHARWKLLRNVLVLQCKLMLGNIHNFVLIPASLTAAALDLLFGGRREGGHFYRILEWGRRADEAINLYGALGDAPGRKLKDDFTVDTIVARLESVIVREYEKGGTSASVKEAVDRALDQFQTEIAAHAAHLGTLASHLAGKLKPPERDDGNT